MIHYNFRKNNSYGFEIIANINNAKLARIALWRLYT